MVSRGAIEMKKILIFGTGFIASNLIDYWSEKYGEIEFIILYNNHKIKENSNVRQYSMKSDIGEILLRENPDTIIILHGDSFVSNNTSITESTNHNVLKASAFLEDIHRHKESLSVKKIVVIGSASEYGKFYNEAIEESFELHPTSIYGLSKIFLFNVSKYFIERGLPIVYVRQFNTLGMNQRDDFVLASFIKNIVQIEKGLAKPTLSVGDLTQERDFLDVRDSCSAYELLIKKGTIGEVYNVASGSYRSVDSLLDKVIQYSQLNKENLNIISNKNLFLKEASLSKRLLANINKLKALGFEQKYTLEDTIKDTFSYWRKNV